jgi:hypothetical protein
MASVAAAPLQLSRRSISDGEFAGHTFASAEFAAALWVDVGSLIKIRFQIAKFFPELDAPILGQFKAGNQIALELWVERRMVIVACR